MYKILISIILVCLGFYSISVQANPFQPDSYKKPRVTVDTKKENTAKLKKTSLKLMNIVMIGNLKKAIFNDNKEASVGDYYLGYRVIKINNDSVVLSQGGREKTLYLESSGTFLLAPVKEE